MLGLPGLHIPDACRRICRGGRYPTSVWREGGLDDGVCVTLEDEEPAAVRHTPDGRRPIAARGDHELATRTEARVVDGAVVMESIQQRAGVCVPEVCRPVLPRCHRYLPVGAQLHRGHGCAVRQHNDPGAGRRSPDTTAAIIAPGDSELAILAEGRRGDATTVHESYEAAALMPQPRRAVVARAEHELSVRTVGDGIHGSIVRSERAWNPWWCGPGEIHYGIPEPRRAVVARGQDELAVRAVRTVRHRRSMAE